MPNDTGLLSDADVRPHVELRMVDFPFTAPVGRPTREAIRAAIATMPPSSGARTSCPARDTGAFRPDAGGQSPSPEAPERSGAAVPGSAAPGDATACKRLADRHCKLLADVGRCRRIGAEQVAWLDGVAGKLRGGYRT
jgi:hypothetical protein